MVASFDKFVTGDELWYLGHARALLDGSSFEEPFIRPPGTSWVYAAVLGVFGSGAVGAVRCANALLTCLTPWMLSRIVLRVLPGRTWAAVAAAALQAVNPVEVLGVQWAMSENLYVPLTLLSVLAALRLAESPTWRRAAVLGLVWGAMLHVRVDCTLVVAVTAAWGAWHTRRGALGGLARSAVPWVGAASLALATCVPWSIHVSRAAGRPVLVAHMTEAAGLKERWGWLGWVSNQNLLRKDWLELYWFGPDWIDMSRLTDERFRTAEEKTRILELVTTVKRTWRLDPAIDAQFEEIAKARREAEPLRFYAVLPALRTLDIWLHPTDSDLPRNLEPTRPSVFTRAAAAATATFRLVTGFGFLAACVLLWRFRSLTGLLAALIVLRTTSFTFGAVIAWQRASYESRYAANVQPLAIVIALAAGVWLLDRRAGAAASRPGALPPG